VAKGGGHWRAANVPQKPENVILRDKRLMGAPSTARIGFDFTESTIGA
jgi:hypothetical protein